MTTYWNLLRTLCVVGFCTFTLTGCPTADLDRDEAAALVLETLNLDADRADAIVFSYPDALSPDQDLRPYDFAAGFRDVPESEYPSEPAAPEGVEIAEESWFFWVDDAPGARFAHPNRFVLVPTGGGDPVVVDREWWPVVDGIGPWVETDAYWDPANHVLATA